MEEIGALAVYLCSEEAGFITGTDIVQEDPEINSVLDAADYERAFSLENQLRHVDRIFERVFGEG